MTTELKPIKRICRDDEWDFYLDFQLSEELNADNIEEVHEKVQRKTQEILDDNSYWFEVAKTRINNGNLDDRDEYIRYFFDVSEDPFPPGDLEY